MTIQLTIPGACLVKMQDAEMKDGKVTGKWVPAAATNKSQPGPNGAQIVGVSKHRRVILDAARHLAIPLQNSSATQTVRVKPRKLVKGNRGTSRWESAGIDGFIPPGKSLDVFVGEGHSAIIEEMPS